MDNCLLYLVLLGYLCLGVASVSSSEMECNGIEEPNKYILCYANSSISLPTHVDVCRCSHLVVPLAVNTLSNASITLDQELVAFLKASGSRNGGRLRRVLSLTVSTEDFSENSSVQSIANSIAEMIDDLLIEGVEIYWQHPTINENSKKDKANLVLFMKELHAVLQEKIIVTNSPDAIGDMNRTSAGDIGEIDATRPLILLRLPTAPEYLVKAFDLKPLARTVDLFVIAAHEMADANNVTYHHSRLMGLSDILNTDSVMDLVASLGVSSDRVVAAVPTFAVQFRLVDVNQNLPGSPVIEAPFRISKEQLCSVLSKGNWTVERDDDLTGTYAYSDEGDWIAFDDEIAAQIKAKYFLLRDVAGVALMPANMNDKLTHGCNPDIAEPSIVQIYYEQFHYQESGERTRRQLATSLQEDVSSVVTALSSSIYNERVRASPYRIVRIVSRSGETSVIRQPLESSLQCSRQGYYRHPEDCGRFYRCVKFDQYIDDFTVFEYDCPEGLVFDERYEVCTWPSQAAPCGGSSEIRPVPMNKFVCPGEGYFADPENCRWFFACRDYAKDGSPFTQYEFRCPFGLLFDEQNLICNWPWLVPQCSGASTVGSIASTSNIDVVKSKTQLEKKQPNAIAIGSPGYLSGKLVTGEGLYTEPRPAQYKEAIVSTGCIDCQSAGLVVRDPSQDTYPGSPPGKQTKLVLAIPAATIADQSTPVRIIVASPASSSQQYTTSTTPQSYVQKYLSTTTAQYQTPYGLSSHGLSGSAGSPVIQQTYESSSSSKLSGPPVMSVPKSSGSLGNGQLPGYPRGQTPITITKNVELQVPSGKDESVIYHSETRSKDEALLSSYSDPSTQYVTPVGVSSPPGLQTHQVTLGYNDNNAKDMSTNNPSKSSKDGIAGGSSYQGKHVVLGLDGSRVYPSGLGSESAQGKHDRYPDVPVDGYVGSVKTEGSVFSYQATAYGAPTGNSQYSEYQEGAAAYQAPTTDASFVSQTHLQSQYQAPAMDKKKPYSTHQVPVSNEKVYESFREAPAPVTKTLVGDYQETVPYYRTSVPTYPLVYKAATPVYTTPIPIYQSPAPVYEASAPVFKASAPIYKASAPAYKAPSPVYQAPSIVYKNPAPSYEAPAPSSEAPAPVYQALAPVYQAPPSVYQTPAIVYQNLAATYEGSAPVYKTPSLAYEAPAAIYNTPAPAHEAPAPTYAAPASSYEAFAPVYRVSTPVYKAPASAYEAPASVYQPPTPVYKAPAYEAPSSTVQKPSPAYETLATVYQTPMPVYRTSTSAYQAPAPFYEVTTPDFQAPPFTNAVPTSVYKASVTENKASIRIHETSATTEQISSSVYVASTPMPSGQAYETIDSSYKPLISGHKTMASIHQAPSPIYEESSDAPKSSAIVDKLPSRVYKGLTSVYEAPLAGIEIFTSRIDGESAAINKATPSSYESPVPNHGTETRPVNDVSASIYKDPITGGSSDPHTYSSVTIRPSSSSTYGFQQTDVKYENVYPYVHSGETADKQKLSYSANSPSKNHGSWNDGKQSSPPFPTSVYDETTEKQIVYGGDSHTETGKTNEAALIRTSSSHTYNAESGNTPQVNQDYGIHDGKNGIRAGTSSYSSRVAPSVQYKSRQKGQVPKEMDSDMADLFHRGSTSESTTKSPRGRLNSSPSSVMHEVKQAVKGNLEINKVGGSPRTGGVGEMLRTSGVGGVGGARRTGGVDETRRAGIGSRTQGSGGLRNVGVVRNKANEAAVAASATGYTGTDYSLARDSPSSEAYGKSNRNTYWSTSRNQDNYEASGLFGDNTFGLKEDVKTKNKYNTVQPAVSNSGASDNAKGDTYTNRRTSNGEISYSGSRIDNGNRDYGSKQQDIPTAINHAGYKGSERVHTEQGQELLAFDTDSRMYQSNPVAKILPSTPSYHDKFSHLPTHAEGITPYGDKRITVKVPSTNKAAILEKWASTSSSATNNTKPDPLEAKRPAGGDGSSSNATPAKSQSSTKRVTSNRQQIKNRITTKPKYQDMTPDTVQSNDELSATDAVTSSSGKKSSDNGLGELNGSDYGNRYLEKITVAQATARNETLGSEVCVRAGLFRHPYDCQKFYECYWDRWIHQYTVHIFKCPVHLVYDDYITACNWPLDGPACVPHEAVKLYPQLPSAA